MRYDPTRQALYHPERDDPLADFSAGWPTDHVCAELSRLAYYRFEEDDADRLDQILAAAGFSAHRSFRGEALSAQAFGTSGPDGTAFVAFRGTQTDDPKDLVVNARFRLVRWDGAGKVHSGFLDAFSSLRAPIEGWLAESERPRLVVTGHSLGAALATLMAAAHEQALLVTFGSPRVGNRAFAEPFAGRAMRRYVDCADEVARVPPELAGYAHIGPMHYIDRFGAVHAPPPGRAAILADVAAANLAYPIDYGWDLANNVLVRWLADHAPVNYVSGALGRREPD